MGGVLGDKWLHVGAKPIFGKKYKKISGKGCATDMRDPLIVAGFMVFIFFILIHCKNVKHV